MVGFFLPVKNLNFQCPLPYFLGTKKTGRFSLLQGAKTCQELGNRRGERALLRTLRPKVARHLVAGWELCQHPVLGCGHCRNRAEAQLSHLRKRNWGKPFSSTYMRHDPCRSSREKRVRGCWFWIRVFGFSPSPFLSLHPPPTPPPLFFVFIALYFVFVFGLWKNKSGPMKSSESLWIILVRGGQ